MSYFSIKIAISALLITLISEISKRSTFWGSILASVPIVSVMALIWLYAETKNIQKVIGLSYGIFWMVLPSLTLFLALPAFLRLKIPFGIALFLSVIAMVLFYFLMIFILKKMCIQI